jgi:hypothetical protein
MLQDVEVGEMAEGAVADERAVVLPSWKRVFVRVVCWFCFGVICGLFPLFFDGVKEAGSAAGVHWDGVLGNGELLIVSAVVSAGALGEMFRAGFPSHEDLTRILIGFGCFLACVGNSVVYMQVSSSSSHFIIESSAYGFVFSLLASACAIWVVALQ